MCREMVKVKYAMQYLFFTGHKQRLPSQNETLNKYERLVDGEASLEEQNGKWLNQVLKKKRERKKKESTI